MQSYTLNEIPLMNSGSELPEFTDKYFRDNWIMKAILGMKLLQLLTFSSNLEPATETTLT
jgi:hypothetical protein